MQTTPSKGHPTPAQMIPQQANSIELYALLSVGSSGSRYKSGVFLKVGVIEHKVEALAVLFARGKRGTFSHSSLRTGHNNLNPAALFGRLFLR